VPFGRTFFDRIYKIYRIFSFELFDPVYPVNPVEKWKFLYYQDSKSISPRNGPHSQSSGAVKILPPLILPSMAR
jgi:hypothetical protein